MKLSATTRLSLILPSLLALAALAAGPTLATETVYVFDTEATEVQFHLGATGHDVEGHLYLDHGEIHLDPATGEARGEMSLQATTAESGSKSRDKTMRGKVLHAVDYPLISFHPDRYTGRLPDGDGDAQLTVHGTITLLGVDHEVDLPANVSFTGSDFTAHIDLEVPFVDWGLHDPSMLFLRVEKVVQVSIDAVGHTVAAATATGSAAEATEAAAPPTPTPPMSSATPSDGATHGGS